MTLTLVSGGKVKYNTIYNSSIYYPTGFLLDLIFNVFLIIADYNCAFAF